MSGQWIEGREAMVGTVEMAEDGTAYRVQQVAVCHKFLRDSTLPVPFHHHQEEPMCSTVSVSQASRTSSTTVHISTLRKPTATVGTRRREICSLHATASSNVWPLEKEDLNAEREGNAAGKKALVMQRINCIFGKYCVGGRVLIRGIVKACHEEKSVFPVNGVRKRGTRKSTRTNYLGIPRFGEVNFMGVYGCRSGEIHP
ncbi:hypothetical protein CPB83DRAFT_837113 [Crepidotus variabilis]|uniref:Uncharacterized protein n=1 Tax=Crepidotus variabilis TaxID=179855 RepID=A0A9P6ED22_9AGAR|nr:hypothetical protein CPB83DRAFT_837113 [Crepidotus variabilis]